MTRRAQEHLARLRLSPPQTIERRRGDAANELRRAIFVEITENAIASSVVCLLRADENLDPAFREGLE